MGGCWSELNIVLFTLRFLASRLCCLTQIVCNAAAVGKRLVILEAERKQGLKLEVDWHIMLSKSGGSKSCLEGCGFVFIKPVLKEENQNFREYFLIFIPFENVLKIDVSSSLLPYMWLPSINEETKLACSLGPREQFKRGAAIERA